MTCESREDPRVWKMSGGSYIGFHAWGTLTWSFTTQVKGKACGESSHLFAKAFGGSPRQHATSKKLLVPPGLTTGNKKLLGKKGIATRSKDTTSSPCCFLPILPGRSVILKVPSHEKACGRADAVFPVSRLLEIS